MPPSLLLRLAPLLPAAAVLLLLAIRLPADPQLGVTGSYSPFTDEGWNVLNARNLVLLGWWSTDDWNLHLVNLPFSLAQVVSFTVLGVGIVQARLVSLACMVAAVALLGLLVASRRGPMAGLVAGTALATSPLVLYYGGMGYLEPMVTCFLVAGAAALLIPSRFSAAAAGLIAGASLALAIGTKPSALFSAAGIVAGVAIGGAAWRDAALRRRLLIGIAVVGVAAGAWVALVAIPRSEAIATVLRIWPAFTLPADPADLARRVTRYFISIDNDRALLYAAPLLIGGAAGALLAALRWRELTGRDRALMGAAIGWFAFGAAMLLVVLYRPNRYVVPLLPPLAILTAHAVSVVGPRLRNGLRPLLLGAALLLLVLPGMATYAGWLATDTTRLPRIQERVAEILPSGAIVQGDLAATFAMRAAVPTLVQRAQSRINPGDLYETLGVRWLNSRRAGSPIWQPSHVEAWHARTFPLCEPWGGIEVCLIELP